jgi:hypothetical protein
MAFLAREGVVVRADDRPVTDTDTIRRALLLLPSRCPWEIAIIRREPDGTQRETLLQISPVDLSGADPFGLRIGHFYERAAGYGTTTLATEIHREDHAAEIVERETRGAHLVGAVPNFDAETLDAMLRRHGLIDVEALAVGYLSRGATVPIEMPWNSDTLSRACGVEPPSGAERHTAMGDARWAMRLYDAITGTVA